MTIWDSVSSTKRFSAEVGRQELGVFQVVHEHCQTSTHDDCRGWYGVHRITRDATATAFRRHIGGMEK